MKKKILALLLSATMIASLAGCGGAPAETAEVPAEPEVEAPAPEAEAPAPEAEAPAPEAEAPAEVTDVSLLVWSPAEDQAAEQGNWLAATCDQFAAEHPEWNITFEYAVCPEGDARTMVTQDVEAAADVYMYANDNLTALLGANGVARLGGDTEAYVKSTNSAAIVDSVSLDGAVYGVPFTTNVWFMYYDKSKFTEEEAGNLDAMVAKDKVAFPLSNSWYLASFYIANGCTMYGNANDEAAGVDFAGDKAVAVTNYLVDLVANPNFINDADGAGMAGLRDGSIGAIFSGSWDYNAVQEALGDNFAAVALPTITIDGAEKQLMAFAGSKAIGVNPNSENMPAAVALAQYLGSAAAQQSHYELRSIVPCNTELLADPVMASDALVAAQNATFDSTSIIQPFVAAMNNYWTPADNMGKALVNGDITHANAAEKTEEFNTLLNTSIIE